MFNTHPYANGKLIEPKTYVLHVLFASALMANIFWGLQACYCVLLFFIKREQSQALAFSFNRVSISVYLFVCLFAYSGGIQ